MATKRGDWFFRKPKIEGADYFGAHPKRPVVALQDNKLEDRGGQKGASRLQQDG